MMQYEVVNTFEDNTFGPMSKYLKMLPIPAANQTAQPIKLDLHLLAQEIKLVLLCSVQKQIKR